ncbi:MAG: trypsin-like peptidase domain-containing protein [Cyanobacteriota bacterium]|nr:trypsin-like peptidase domain-containing protein [Cyanobacteriota bacterium]
MKLKAIIPTMLIGVLLYPNAIKSNSYSLQNPTQIAARLTEAEIKRIAEQITVRIDGDDRGGTGVIVEKKDDTYYVLTNWHVVNKAGDYQIITPDGKQHPVYYSLIQQVPGIDLAIAPFHSTETYPIAQLGNDSEIPAGKSVYVSGWPRSGGSLQQRIFINSTGIITGRQQPINGYSLLYDNLVRAGMSGGPVLDIEGRLVAINGIVKLEEDSDKIVSGGIEINTFLNWRQTATLPTLSNNPEILQNNPNIANPSLSNSPVNGSSGFSLASSIAPNSGTISSLSISDSYFVSGNSNGSFTIGNLATGEIIAEEKGHEEAINSIAINSQAEVIASASDDKTIKIWNLNNRELLNTLTGHSDAVSAVVMSPAGDILASGSWDKTIKIWNLQTGELLQTLDGHTGLISALTISDDGEYLASGSKDSTIKLWNLQTGELIRTFSGHNLSVLAAAISPDGKLLASGSADGSINLWELETGELIRSLNGHLDGVWSVAIAPDNQTLISGSWDKTVKIWEISSGELKDSLSQHSGYVNAVAIAPDGQTIISAGWDGKINIWRKE